MSDAAEMRLFNASGDRLYLNNDERRRFLAAAAQESPADRLFCYLMNYTGCRPSEALELTRGRIQLTESEITFRTMKKRKRDQSGNLKVPQYRTIPVPASLIESLDLVFDLNDPKNAITRNNERLWAMSRSTAWRLIKRVMKNADISGAQATCKGLRHGFGVAMATAEKPLPIHILSQLMGHTDTKTTEIYLQVVGMERKKLILDAWG